MLEIGDKPVIGHKIRQLRQSLGLTQADMAETINISASYLNLIENNQRPITVSLLFKLGQAFDINLKEFAHDDSTKLNAHLTEMFADPAFGNHAVSRRELRDFVANQPNIASTLSQFYSTFLSLKSNLQNASIHEGSGRHIPVAISIVDQMRDYLEQHENYFSNLETAADDFIHEAGLRRDTLYSDICAWFQKQHGLDVRIMPTEVMDDSLRRYDPHRRRILLSEALRRPQRIFQLLTQTALLQNDGAIDAMVDEASNPAITDLLKTTLAGYFAGAVMMPYKQFFDAARSLRYDIDLLGRRFGVSFEQVCHRLTTLNKAGERGIPFFFIRVDPAGNVSKRLAAGRMQFASRGGTCGRWIVHHAFRVPSKILVQVAELEGGEQVFTLARTVSPLWTPPNQPEAEFAVALGCDVAHAKDIVHADGLDISKSNKPVPIGIGCHICERLDCSQRSQPPLGHHLRFDPYIRKPSLFDIEG